MDNPKILYTYDSVSRIYLGLSIAAISDVGAVDFAPPNPASVNKVWRLNDAGDGWVESDYLEGVQVYSTSDGTALTLTDVDVSVPDGYTLLPRPTPAHDWSGSKWVLNKTKQTELDAAARKAAVPQVVTMRQAKLALLQAGLLDEVDAAIAAETTPKAIKIEWEYASEVQRDWVNTLGLAAMLGLTDEQLDNLFVLAASL